MTVPDAAFMVTYCDRTLPDLLTGSCGIGGGLAQRIGVDVMHRAEALAALSPREQDVLIAPFVEEVFHHEPADAPLDLKAKVALVVRNSLIRQAHYDGPLSSGIVAVTRQAAAPLSHFLGARQREPVRFEGPGPFAALAGRYPRAWACLEALTDAFTAGGRRELRLRTAPVPSLPAGTTDEYLHRAAKGGTLLHTSALSRYSRDSETLHRTLEFLLAHRASVLTTNYLIRDTEVWVRHGELVAPDSDDPYAGARDPRGLTGAHAEIAANVAARRNAR